MALEVDQLLVCMSRVEKLEGELAQAEPAEQSPIRRRLDPAKKAESAAFGAVVLAAHRGDPEAIVALDALIEQKTRSAA